MEKILNFGKKTKKEAISFLEEIEKKFETSLHYYKEEIRDSNDNDKFELVYYANDKELWALENVSENEVIFDHKILDCCLKEDESEIIKEASIPLTMLSEALGYFMSGVYSPEKLKQSLVEDGILKMLEKSKTEIDIYLERIGKI